MNGSAPDRLIRYLDYPDDVDQPPIFNETLGGFVRPDWLAISRCPEFPSGQGTSLHRSIITSEAEEDRTK